ncbi:hypothetical protein ACZ90_12430 [Streptomyces albus subsp. albus]|nr:hypothetical protein ACZ90_12430 [Streptomyces albus subsp. albus]
MTPGTIFRLDHPLRESARSHPDRPALAADGRLLRYAELDQAVSRLAEELTSQGVRPGHRLGVLVPKSVPAVLALYAGLRLGAIVAPLDPTEPAARLARMLHGAALTHLLTTPDTDPTAERTVARLPLEGAGGPPGRSPGEEPRDRPLGTRTPLTADPTEPLGLWTLHNAAPDRPDPTEGNGGYVLFTSGSTGHPKGVLLPHRAVAHFAAWAAAEFALTAADRIGSQAALTFDLSTFDLFSAALAGACVHLMPEALRLFPRDAVDWLAREEISVLYAVPTLYRSMLEAGGIEERPPGALRIAAFAGEPFPARPLERYLRRFPQVRFYNLYGPTETNVCTYQPVPPDWTAADGLPVGLPVPGDLVEVTDEQGRWTDAEGEVQVAGATLLLGYLQDGELTDPTRPVRFRDGTVRRAYPTGDLGRFGAGGRLELRGRRDHQVKRRGVRIDLLDIESALLELPEVAAAAVVAKSCPGHAGELWAYAVASQPVEGAERQPTGPAELLRALGRALPRRMLPDRVLMCEALPYTARGKTDRTRLAQLPAPAPAAPADGGTSR